MQVYTDQYPSKWEEFIQRPVKSMLSSPPFTEIPPSASLDVWDRQYMTTRMIKFPVQEAQLFMISIRMETTAIAATMRSNGEEGKYFERWEAAT